MALRWGFKTEAEEIARDVRAELDLSPYGVLDPHSLTAHLEIPVLELTASDYPADVIRQFTRVDPEAFSAVTVFHGRRRVIVHNDSHAPVRQNSNITHEASHALLLHEPSPAFDERGFRIWYEDQEDEANHLCGCLLVTRQAALQVARKGISIDAAAAFYGVSLQMMSWRVNGTGALVQAKRERAARQRRGALRVDRAGRDGVRRSSGRVRGRQGWRE